MQDDSKTMKMREKATPPSAQSAPGISGISSFATELLEPQHSTTLTDTDRDRLLELLDTDDEPNEALREAFETHERLIVE